jgi:hypothetical protein
MKGTGAVVLVAVAAVLLGGCGTILNFAQKGGPDVYGGVQKDITFFMSPPAPEGQGSPRNGDLGLGILVLTDAVASLTADTLTLPLVVYLRQDDKPIEAGTKRELASSSRPSAPAVSLGKPCAASQTEAKEPAQGK